jgi:phospholipid-transporting ATPase
VDKVTDQFDLYKVYDHFETNLQYLGVAVVQDELQDGAPRVVNKLREAGIKTWILTGDKLETALYVANSCSLAGKDSAALCIVAESREDYLE